MGKISTYQRDKFASSVVGAPQEDVSLAPVADAIQKPIQAKVDAELAERYALAKKQQEINIDLAADNVTMRYSLAAQRLAQEHMEANKDNPTGVTETLVTSLTKLNDEYLKEVADDRVRVEVAKANSTVIKQLGLQGIKWETDQIAMNNEVLLDRNTSIAAQACGGTTDLNVVANNLQNLADMVNNTPGVDAAKGQTLIDKKLNEGFANYRNNFLAEKPREFIKMVEKGGLDNVKVTSNGKVYQVKYTAKDRQEDIARAEKIFTEGVKQDNIRGLLKDTTELNILVDRIGEGKQSVQQILDASTALNSPEQVKAIDNNPDLSPQEKIDKKRILEKKRAEMASAVKVTLVKSAPVISDNDTLINLDSQWRDLATGLKKKGVNKGKQFTDPIASLEEALTMQTSLNEAYSEGKLSWTDYSNRKKELNAPLLQAIAQQSGQKQWYSGVSELFGFGPKYQTEYGAFYEKIDQWAKQAPMPDTEKAPFKARVFSSFMDGIVKAKDDGRAITPEVAGNILKDTYFKTLEIYNPKLSGYQEGDYIATDYGVFKTKRSSSGQIVADYPAELQAEIDNSF